MLPAEFCSHPKDAIVEEFRGSRRFVNGDVDDDITTVEICTRCGHYLKRRDGRVVATDPIDHDHLQDLLAEIPF